MRSSTSLICGLLMVLVSRLLAEDRLPGPEGLGEQIVDGKLQVSVADVVRLTLLNNPAVRLSQLQYEGTRFAIQKATQAFDPVLSSFVSADRAKLPTTSQLEGAPTLSDLSQQAQMDLSKTFSTGLRSSLTFNANKFSSNSIFNTFNPSFSSDLTLSLTQPLLRNRGLFPNRAPILIAKRSYRESRATFETALSEQVAKAVDQYWTTVRDRQNLAVQRQALELAEATEKQDERRLELGALPPLDIYRSEAQVAARRVQAIQAEYQLRQSESELKRLMGADLDERTRLLPLELVDEAETQDDFGFDEEKALERALSRRPELLALAEEIAVDDATIDLARNNLRPDLNLTGYYKAAGRGGSHFDVSTSPPTLLSKAGLEEALRQVERRDFPSYGFKLQLRLPFKNPSAEADLATALVSKQKSLYSLRQQRQSIALEVHNASNQVEQAKLSVAAAKKARDLAQKNLEAEQRKYELGVDTLFFVIDAQTQLAQAQQNLVETEISYRRAATAIARATGSLLEDYRVQVREPAP